MQSERKSVLVVDDERDVREALSRALSEAGYVCHEAASAEEARKLASERSFTLALCDIGVSAGDGRSLLVELKRMVPDIAVIMVSAPAEVHMAVDCLPKGADSYLIKPVNSTELREVTSRALDRRRAAILEREYEKDLEARVRERTGEVQRTFLNAIESLAYCLDAKDPYTKGHSERVARLSVGILRAASVEHPSEEQLRLAAKIHDIGNIGLREAVLNKPGPLTEEEFEHVKTHPSIAARILRPAIQDTSVTDIILHHHERYDGRGYPTGLKGEEIPLGARILAVAGSFDAMTSPRPYRPPDSPASAIKEIVFSAGTWYDPNIAKVVPEVLGEPARGGEAKHEKLENRGER